MKIPQPAQIFVLFLIGILFLQSAMIPQSINQGDFYAAEINLTFHKNDEITLTGMVTVGASETREYINKTIYYDSSETPIFTVYGTLKIINCKIVPLQGSVDFINGNNGHIFLKNVTFVNSAGSASIFSLTGSSLYLDQATFSGFYGASISDSEDIYISNMYANITGVFTFYNCGNITIVNSRIDYSANDSVRLLEISQSNGLFLENNTITIPVEVVEAYSAWLEGISLSGDTNVIVRGNIVINGGKTLVSYGSSNVLIINNTFMNEKLVEGTELQIDQTSQDITIINNSFSGLWEAIEVYSHNNITITGNIITQSETGIKVEPAVSSEITKVYVYNNTLINSNLLIFYCNGMVFEKNIIENCDVVVDNSKNITLQQNLLKNVTIDVMNSKEINVINNTIYVCEGRDWLSIENSTVTEEDNAVITLPCPGGGQDEEDTGEEPTGGEEETEEQQDWHSRIPVPIELIFTIALIGLIAIVIITIKRRKGHL